MVKRVLFIAFLILILAAPVFAQTNQPIPLKDGFNFISFTVNPSLSPSQLKASNPIINDIYLYNTFASAFFSLNAGELSTIAAGRGYIIKTSAAGTINVSGTAVSSDNAISLKTGFNLVGFSKMPEKITFTQLMQRASSIKGLYKWNASANTFLAVIRNGSTIEKIDGVDSEIKLAESYFFNMLEDTTLDYNGTSITVGGGGSSNRAAAPTFNPPGGSYSSPQSVVISCATSGAAIRYTTDGTTPTTSSQLYISPISVSQTTTISAIAIKAGLDNSYVSSATYTFGQAQAPAITSVIGTSVDNGNDTVKITFNTPMNKASVETASNWSVKYADSRAGGGETVLNLTATPFFYDSNNLTLTISLQKVSNIAYLPNGKYVAVTPSSNIKSANGASLSSAVFYSAAAVSGDLLPPNPLPEADKIKLSFNNAAYKVSIINSPLTANREPAILEVYAGSSAPATTSVPTAKSIIKGNNGFLPGDIITGMATVEVSSAGVWYRFSDGAGNKSNWTQDGFIPGAPNVNAVSLNNRNGEINIGATAITSSAAGNNSILVYYDYNGMGNGLTLHDYTAKGQINSINAIYPATAKNGFWTPIADGNQISYAIKNIEDNISARAYDRSNPPAPVKANKIFISAFNKMIHCSKRLNDITENTDMTLYMKVIRGGSDSVYKSNVKFSAGDPDPKLIPFSQFAHVSGDIITSTFPRAGDKISYALEKAGRISSYTEDGDIPAAPDANKLAYFSSSAAGYPDGGYVVVSSNAVSDPQITGIICYQSDDAQGASNTFVKGKLTQVSDWSSQQKFLARNSNSNPPVVNSSNIEAGKYVLYTHVNNSGNISAYTVDGIIPARPFLPEANILVGAGDGGAGAEAGYINKNGHAAVKLRPAIPLIAGEAVAITAVSAIDGTKYVTMTARASHDATPVFGEQTPDVAYIPGPPSSSGDSLSGALTFAGNLLTGDIRVSASKINANGNASQWSDFKILKYPASMVPPAVFLPGCRTTDDDGDGKLNTLVLEFNTEMKINGSLNTSKSLTGFHNGITVFNGMDSVELIINKYLLSPNNRQLIIELSNSVAGTGLVGINIVNADQNNYLSDLFGNRLAPINLDGSGGRAIADLVAPPLSKIITSNLSHDNFEGKVTLESAAIECGEKAKLEIYFGASPAVSTNATASTAAFTGKHQIGVLISSIARQQDEAPVYYRLVDEAGNKTAWVQDGKVPSKPNVSLIAYRAYETVNHATVEIGAVTGTNSTLSKLICYQADNAAGGGKVKKGTAQGIDLSRSFSFSANEGGIIASGKHVLYSLVNEYGNISDLAYDGVIPDALELPAASELVKAGDGGTSAAAGFVNSSGSLEVTIRPMKGSDKLSGTEAVTLKAVLDDKTLMMRAKAKANNIVPVFGGSTANVEYSNFGDTKNGNPATGSFNFSTLSTGRVSISGYRTNTASGNSSAWSPEAINIIYGASDSQPAIKVSECYATDDDKDGNLNYLFIKFDREMQITGTLDPEAGMNKFHYGITVNNGSIDVPLKVISSGGYSIINDADSKKTLLKIALDNTVRGTGLVKINIFNADPANYIHDLFGNKLAAISLDGTAGKAIPDKVAPSSGTGILDKSNLFFSKASRKVECLTSVTCSERVKLDIFFGTYPLGSTTAVKSSAITSANVIGAGTIMTLNENELPNDGNRVWYRLVDSTDTNKSDWVEDGTIPASPPSANMVWSDINGQVTINTSPVASNSELLRIYRKNAENYTYLGRVVAGGGGAAAHNDKYGPYLVGQAYLAENPETNEAVKVHVSSGDAIAYSIYNENGNESSYSLDTNSPPDAPIAEKLYVNAEGASIVYGASINNSTNNALKLYLRITRGATVAVYKAKSSFSGDSAGELAFSGSFDFDSGTAIADFPKPGDAVEYALANSNNKISAYVSDGVIPIAPTNANKFTYNASTNTVNYASSLNGSANTAFKLFVHASDAAGNNITSFASNNALVAGPAALKLEECNRTVAKGSESTVYDIEIPAVKAGILLKYGVINANGNVSKLTSSITVPAAPLGTKISYSAATGMVTAAAGVSTMDVDAVLSCYQADTPAGANLSTLKGSVTGVNFSATEAKFEAKAGGIIEANKYVLYTLTDANGNVSSFANDGFIPAPPYPAKLFYSANESSDNVNVNVFSGATNYTNSEAVLTCYQSSDATGTTVNLKGSIKASEIGGGKNLTNAFQFTANTGGVINVNNYVLYTITNEHGNESAYVADGTIPAPPSIPQASSLILAGDGGPFASAGCVNTAGHAAVTMRPAIALLAGETFTLKVSDGAVTPNVIKMSAFARNGATPVFGGQTPGVSYSASTATDGDVITGSFKFESKLTTKAVFATAAIANTNGNTSVWAAPAVEIAYNVTGELAPAITAASSYATDDDKDGKLNTLVIKFTKPIKINGTLSTTAGAGNFHNVISVNNGVSDVALNVTGYSINGDNNDLLTITFDNAVAGTGQVKANIVNANASNFISDLYGVKLAPTNLKATGAENTIPDTVAPSASKINVANLFYSRATGKVALKNAAIDCGESAKIEVFFGADPNFSTAASASTGLATRHDIKSDLISVLAEGAYGVYYRLVDNAATPNKSDWVSDGGIPEPPSAGSSEAPNIAWSDSTSQFTINNIAIGSPNSLLRIYRKSGAEYTYLGRAVNDESNVDKKGIYAVGAHWAKKDIDSPIQVYNLPGDIAAFTLFNDNGNESAWVDDPATALPIAKPLADKIQVNAQEKTIRCATGLNGSINTGLRLCLKVTRGTITAIYKAKALFTDNNSKTLTFINDFNRTSTASLDDFPMAGDEVSYALESLTGKISEYTSYGAIPAGPLVTSKFKYNAAENKIYYPASINGASNLSYKLFVEASKGTDKVLFYAPSKFADNNAGNIGLDGFSRLAIPALNEANVYSSGLKDGVTIKYSLIDDKGNISTSVAGGTVPAAPDATKLAYSLALNSVTTLPGLISSTNTSVTLNCYLANDANGSGIALKGTKTGVNFKDSGAVFTLDSLIAAGKYVIYTITDETGNTSAYTADGVVPDVPVITSLAYSAINGEVSTSSGVTASDSGTTCVLRCYQADDSSGASNRIEKGSKTGVNFKNDAVKFTANANGGAIEADKYVIYSFTNENGNTSAFINDGIVPFAPAAPALSDLALRKGTSAGKYKVERVDNTTPGDILPSMDILLTLDGAVTLVKCGSTNGSSVYTAIDDLGGINTLVLSMTPKYAYKNANDNISALSAADGALQSLSAVSLEPMGGVITFTFSAAVNGNPEQADFDTGKSGVMALAANNIGTAASATAAHVTDNWQITGDAASLLRIFTIKPGANRKQNTAGQLLPFGDGTTDGGKLFNLAPAGTTNIFDTAGGNFLIPASADRKISFNLTSDASPALMGVKGETASGGFTPLANGISIINKGKFHLEFNKPVLADMTILKNSTTTTWASGTPPVFDGASCLSDNLTTMVLSNTANPGQVTSNDTVKVTKTAVKDLIGKSPAADYQFTVVSDATPPAFNSITVQNAAYNNNVVALTFSKSVWWGVPLTDPAHISATVGDVERTVSAITARAKGSAAATLNVTLAGAAITDGQAVAVTITATGAAVIKDNTAQENTLSTGILTRNTNYAADTTPPTFDSIVVQSVALGGNVIKLIFNEPVWWTGLGSGDLTVSVNGESRSITKIGAGLPNTRLKGDASTSVNVTVDGAAITNGQTVFVAITLTGSAKIKDNSYSENIMQGTQNKTVTASVSTAPNPNHFFANARTKTITINGSTPNAVAKIYVGNVLKGTVTLGSNGSNSTIVDLSNGESMHYSLTEAGKIESVLVADGVIPYATIDGLSGGSSLALCMQASGVTDKVKSSTALVGSGCYLLVNNASATGFIASADLIAGTWVSPKTQRGGVGLMTLDAGGISYQFENADGNSSTEVTDGNIAPAPNSSYVHIDQNGKIASSNSSTLSDTYTVYYTVSSTPPVSSLNENEAKMLKKNSDTVATLMVLPAVNSSVIGDKIQWVTYDSSSGNYSEGSPDETLVGVGNQASAFTNQAKLASSAGASANIFTTTSANMDYVKILFTGPIVVPDAGLTLDTFGEFNGPIASGTKTNSAISAIAGKNTNKSSVVLKISSLNSALISCQFSLKAGTTRFNLTSATTKITDAYGNAVFPAASGPIIMGDTAQNETDD